MNSPQNQTTPPERSGQMPGSPLPDTAENRLKKTLFIVEATSTEQYMLWKDYAINSDSPRHKPMDWRQVNPGWLVTVGKIGKRPCCISVSWCRIDGQLVMFWHQCSQVTDSLKAEAWLTANFSGTWDSGRRRAWTDAGNFHACVHAIQEANDPGVPAAAGGTESTNKPTPPIGTND